MILQNQFDFLKHNGIYEREQLVWNQNTDVESEWNYLKDWLQRRLSFLDSVFIQELATAETEPNFEVKVVPNPLRDHFSIYYKQNKTVTVEIYDYNGRIVYSNAAVRSGEPVEMKSWISRGNYLMIISDGAKKKTVPIILQ